ncbi:type VI secretion system membrane subunit TssM [uncultured Limnobacter sp.]|uniref:type VI secretion system membrane subunit TssM n=1 Tax=uncultured Limnobacter sp. TaxID=199681 RepID=UPI0030F6C7DC
MFLRFALSLLAFSGFAVFIWLVGPIIAIGEIKPFEKWWAQALLILIVGLLVFIPLTWRWWKVRTAEQALKAGLTRQDEQAFAQTAKLQDIFNQAVHMLKQHQSRKAWYQSKPGLYQLPWYVMIGPPGSGKTTALKNAGLRFPLQDPLGKDAIKGVGGTRNCDWWFTDQAVLIDTAGRFTTQDSDHNTDSAGWNSFLNLLKKHRPKQPLNGVLLTISVQELLDSESKQKDTATKISLRLQEMIRALGMCPPVYVLITKLDLLTGFRETFGRLAEVDRAKAWGVNFDHPNALDTTLKQTLPNALSHMVEHLGEQLNQRLEEEEQENKRIKLFEFPLAFAQLKPAIEGLLQQALQSDSPFEQPVVLRGVYLSSGTQEGNVFDRIALGIAPNKALETPTGKQGKSFFIRELLAKVVFQEQHLAGYVKKTALFERAIYIGLLGGSAALLSLLLLGWWISYSNNSTTLDQTLQTSRAVSGQASTLQTESQASLQPLFSTLSRLQDIAQPSPAGFTHHLGLNQDDKLRQAEQLAYHKALETALMPRIAKRLEDRLRTALNQDMELAYESLKAYVMIHSPTHYDAQALASWVVFDWQQNVLASYAPPLQDAAIQHLQAAIALGAPGGLPEKDDELIETARQVIGAQALDDRLYKRMVRFYRPEPNGGFNLIGAVGASSAAIFTRPSGQSLSQGIDAIYTRDTYIKYFLKQLPDQANRLTQESSWVMGESRTSSSVKATQISELLSQVRGLYIRDYIRIWDSYLKDVQIQRPAQFEQAVDLARVLASPQSPLKKFLEEVSENTRLAGGLVKTGEKLETLTNQKAQQTLSPSAALLAGSDFKATDFEAPLEQQVDDYFSDINNLFEGNPPAYNQVSGLLNDLYAQLAAIASAKKSKSAPPPAASMDSLLVGAGVLPEPVRAIVGQLAGQGSAQGRAAERANLSADLRPLQEICRRTVSNRYPIHPGSGLDVLSDDFARFFAPNGLMDQFFMSRLSQVVDTGGPSWKLKPLGDGSQAPNNPSLIQFQRAARIRDVFFSGNSAVAKFDVEMRLVQSSHPSDVFYLETNGELKMFSKQFQPSHRIQWGGQAPSSTLRIRASEGAHKTYNGPWALFRMFDAAQIENTERPEKFRARFVLEGKQFDFEVLANSAFNPLRLSELRQFRCPGNL